MFLSLWHYLQGYVIVEISGFNVEKFLNLTTYHGLILWNIQRIGEKVYFSTSIEDFKAMKQDARKTRSRLKIVEKYGLPFFTYRYKKRKLFAIGIGIFIMMLWLLSSFVWLVEVEGSHRINSLDIIHTLEENGYSTGNWKGKMNLREAETILLKHYPDIIWVGIDYEGTRMIVRVAESILPPTMNALDIAPSSLIAKRDALITYIAVEKGKPMVKAGDIVKKGDMLVAGEMPLGEEDPSPYYTASKATIRGKTIYTVSGDISLDQVRKNYTNETSKKYILKFFDKNLTLFSEKALTDHYDKMLTLHQLRITKLFPLPFAVEVQTCISYVPAYYTLTKEEAEDRLLSELWNEVSESLSGEVRILKREAYFKQTDRHISGTLYVVAEEEISYPVGVEQEMQNKGEMLNE
ncbi:MAG: sporulation protein YqfD [Candidatus Cellulosilyticum pullistercoris]|uniref:Sporulation protein YqfD n=1 Tax=Candidatus Cellulosilyticum pullistercoris TaxID=2838521 RepID=A0A9E2KA94_9FIRM|nr:sporulation protein YqfD [Candidatus Cellulosilyticum pullistercoris]